MEVRLLSGGTKFNEICSGLLIGLGTLIFSQRNESSSLFRSTISSLKLILGNVSLRRKNVFVFQFINYLYMKEK